MGLKDIQKQVDDWILQTKIEYWSPHEMLARLAEETGELAREVNHLWGPKKKKTEEEKNELGGEMADIIFTLCCMANSLKIDLDDHFRYMLDKLNSRDKDRWDKKD